MQFLFDQRQVFSGIFDKKSGTKNSEDLNLTQSYVSLRLKNLQN